jgi:hypothetical protein
MIWGRKLILVFGVTWALSHLKPHALTGFPCEEKGMSLGEVKARIRI